MDHADYGDSSDEETFEASTSKPSSTRSKKRDRSTEPMGADDKKQPSKKRKTGTTNNNNENMHNLASLASILQSHQQSLITSSSANSSKRHQPNSTSKESSASSSASSSSSGSSSSDASSSGSSSTSSSRKKSKKKSSSSSSKDAHKVKSTVEVESNDMSNTLPIDLNSILAPTIQSLLASTNTSASLHGQTASDSNSMLQSMAAAAVAVASGHDSQQSLHDTVADSQAAAASVHGLPLVPVIQDASQTVAYFILRSNNEENVRTSMEKGVWATQPQNEAILNEAFEKFDKVLLFFSVCRSMHFQGLSQMTSPIGHHKSRSLWESEPNTRGRAKWGGTFTVQWLRIFDLPFEQTNHICNPWNNNKPIKFSRDGQAVPANVGAQLVHLFDIGVMEFGQGSAILRKPIQMDAHQIAVQKLYVNGRFVPATDIATAQSMIALEQEEEHKHQLLQQQQPPHQARNRPKPSQYHNNNGSKNIVNDILSNTRNQEDTTQTLNRLVATLQKQAAENGGVNVLDNMTVNAVAKILGDLDNMNQQNMVSHDDRHSHRNNNHNHNNQHSHHAMGVNRHHRDDRDRHRGARKYHHGNHPHMQADRGRGRGHGRHGYGRSRSRSRERRSHRRDYHGKYGHGQGHGHRHHHHHREHGRHRSSRHRHEDDEDSDGSSVSSPRYSSKRSGKDKRRGGDDKKSREQEKVINSLWTQIQLQQALLSQNTLYNALNTGGNNNSNSGTSHVGGAAMQPSYPSNRGGVY